MKILQVHNSYMGAGGEDKVLQDEKDIILKEGHEVCQFIKTNQTLKKNLWRIAKLIVNTHYNKSIKTEFRDVLEREKPDIVHVHNFFPLISPSIFDVTAAMKVPSIMTLHNYRIIHPNGLILNGDAIDEISITESAYRCIHKKVYRNSFLQTAVVAHMIEFHRKRKTWTEKIDKFIALTEFAKNKFHEGGIPLDKVIVKANSTQYYSYQPSIRENFFLFVGRLSSEKGIRIFLDAAEESNAKFEIIGDGPEKNLVLNCIDSNDNIKYWGYKDRDFIMERLSKCTALVFPSIWFEGLPITIIEAFSTGTPVLVSNLGNLNEIVTDEKEGLTFDAGDKGSLNEKMHLLMSNIILQKRLGENARLTYLTKYTREVNAKSLLKIYNGLISQ